MNKDIKQRWVTALRSKKYKQARNALYNPRTDGYCCLGVLHDLAAQDGICHLAGSGTFVSNRNESDSSPSVLIFAVQDWADLENDNPDVQYNGRLTSLAEMNDDSYDFDVIADVIEKQL